MNIAAQNPVQAMDSPVLTSSSVALALVLICSTLLVQPHRVLVQFPSRPPRPPLPPQDDTPPMSPPRPIWDDRPHTAHPHPSRDDTPPTTPPSPKKNKHIAPLPQPRINANQDQQTPPPSRDEHEHNLGKKIGLLFTGIAAGLQVCVVAFLVLKSRKLFKIQNSD